MLSRRVLFLVILTSVVLLAVPSVRSELQQMLLAFFDAVQRMEDWGPVVIGAAFVPAALLFVPGAALTLFGGFAFGGTVAGFARVTACVSIGSTLGAGFAFLVGRYLARDWIERQVAARPTFRSIDDAVGRAGFRIVLLTRLSPVFPFNLLNYALGLTSVSFRDYLLASWLGMLPGTMLYVYVGSTLRQLADVLAGNRSYSPAQQIFFGIGLAATVLVAVVIARIARRALKRGVATSPAAEARDDL